MEKEKNSNCLCICMCLCMTMFLFCCLTSKIVDIDRNLCSNIFFFVFFILLVFCTYLLIKDWRDNKRILSQSKDIESMLKDIENGYKGLSKQISECSYNKSSDHRDDGLCKTLEMITITFSNKNCDDSKLKILKEVIDAIIKGREKGRQTNPNSEQDQDKA